VTRREVVRYATKGAAFVALNVAAQLVLVERGDVAPAIAAAVSTATMPLLGYLVMEAWVFPDAAAVRRWGHLQRFGQYYAVIMSSKVANYLGFLALLAVGVWYPVAYVAAAGVVFLASFALNRRVWVSVPS